MDSVKEAVTELWKIGWTYNAMSKVLGVSRYTLARWADGVTEPVAAIPILFALRAMAQLHVPDWPRMAGDPPLPALL
jgi:transcriptional regulator with XRE-family HTH domain